MDLKSIGETLVSSNLTAVVLCCLPLFLRLASPLLPPRLASPCALFLDALVLVFVVGVCTARVMCVCVCLRCDVLCSRNISACCRVFWSCCVGMGVCV